MSFFNFDIAIILLCSVKARIFPSWERMMQEQEWSEQELAKVLYQSDVDGTYPVQEYKDAFSVSEEEKDTEEENAALNQDGQKEEKQEDADADTQDVFLTLNDDSLNPTTTTTSAMDRTSSQPPTIIIAKFYAHWCPHWYVQQFI